MDLVERMAASAKRGANPMKAIRAFCYNCLGGMSPKKECIDPDCALYDFRDGKNSRRQVRRFGRCQAAMPLQCNQDR